MTLESKKITSFLVNVTAVGLAIFLVYYVLSQGSGVYQQEVKTGNWDLTTTAGRELASISKPVSAYNVKKCGEVKHTDGDIMTVCIVTFNGTSGGFYDSEKSLMVLGSFNESTLVHEIFHAASIHNYKKGYTKILEKETQEKMAYDAENLLMQIRAFQEDLSITPDLSNEKKQKLGVPLATVYSENVATTTKVNTVNAMKSKTKPMIKSTNKSNRKV